MTNTSLTLPTTADFRSLCMNLSTLNRLIRRVPADITSCGPLTRHEASVCQDIAAFAEAMHAAVVGGLSEVLTLLATAPDPASRVRVAPLIRHLNDAVKFYGDMSADYLAASAPPHLSPK